MIPGAYGGGAYGSGPYGGSMLSAEYYLSLLTSEYQNATKLKAWLRVIIQLVIDIDTYLALEYYMFDVDNAVGAQLDVLGVIVGASRTVGFQPSGGISPVLDDVTYRIYIKAKVAQNQWNGQVGSLWGIWSNLFPGGTIAVQDNQNMTATIFLAGAFTSIIQDLITNGYIVPRPQAVQYTYVFAALPILGFDFDDTYIAGFDVGHFA